MTVKDGALFPLPVWHGWPRTSGFQSARIYLDPSVTYTV